MVKTSAIISTVLLAGVAGAAEPTFANVTATVAPGLTGVNRGSTAWGDYDNDGRLDLLITGYRYADGDTYISELWRNTESGFVNVTATVAPGLPGLGYGSVAWGDYDNDGWLDLLLTGHPCCDLGVSQIWRNTGSGFTNVTDTVAPGMQGVYFSAVAWGDYDSDGRLDFLLAGGFNTDDGDDYSSQFWRNTGSGFSNVTDTVVPGLPAVGGPSLAWGDFDNDGRLDFLLTGYDGQYISQIWRNTGSGFSNVTDTVAPELPSVSAGAAAWADYDNDGRLDFLLTGTFFDFINRSNHYISQIWRNTGSGFSNVTATVAPDLPGLGSTSLAWGDYDNDGRLDFLLTGTSDGNYTGAISQVWRNTGTGFTNVTATVAPGLPELWFSSVVWADYDNDGRLDFLLTGYDADAAQLLGVHRFVSQIWRNYTPITNTPPSAPTGLAMTATADAVMLSWNSATDAQTPASGLTYNVRAGTTPGGTELLSAHVNATNGFRRVPAMGNAMLRHSLPLTGLTNGQTVYWSVQAVDTAFAGGAFASETNVVSQPQPVFTNVTAMLAPNLPLAWGGPMAWGDFDNDGRLDLFLTGSTVDEYGDVFPAQFWRNTGSGFTNVTTALAPDMVQMKYYDAAWGDYDNDGRLDLFVTAYDDGISLIWRNTPSGFTNVTASVAPGLPRVGGGAVAWGDFDNDGHLDFLLTGTDEGEPLSQIWRNTGSGFSNVTATVAPGLPEVVNSAVAWGDYDNDGWLDFLLTGYNGDITFTSQLWRNTGTRFVNVTDAIAPGLPGVADSGSVAWADYDNDGRLDFLLTGYSFGIYISQIWRNTGSGFSNVTDTLAPGLPGLERGAWGDFDNDGWLDFLLTGYSHSDGFRSQLWRNTTSGFANVTAVVAPGLSATGLGTAAAWGDYDNDGRLDLLLPGIGRNDFVCQLWRNYTPITNTPPSAPTGLAMTATADAVMLSWNSATDGQTPASGLAYNVRAGTTPGGTDLLSAHVNATNGFRRVPAMGNAMLRHSLPLTGLTNGQTVYWSVQAVDTAFSGGPFAAETSIVSLPQLTVSLNSQPSTVNLSWTPPTFGWVLQQSTNISASNWIPTASGGDANPTIVPATNGAQFYRLYQP